jgi:signal transduction histidine kinase
MPEPGEDAGSSSEGAHDLALLALRNGERRAAMIRLASSLSHALGTPLNVIAGRAAMISMDELPAEEVAQNARIIEAQVRSITELLQKALRFVREGPPANEPTDLVRLARQAASVVEAAARARQVTVTCAAPAELTASVPPNRILCIVTDLLSLGIDLLGPGGRLALELRRGHADPPPLERGRASSGECAQFAIRFEGMRLDDELFRRVYEPWLDPPSDGRDAALLLAVAFGMAREHRAWLEPRQTERDTTLTLYWPLVAA